SVTGPRPARRAPEGLGKLVADRAAPKGFVRLVDDTGDEVRRQRGRGQNEHDGGEAAPCDGRVLEEHGDRSQDDRRSAATHLAGGVPPEPDVRQPEHPEAGEHGEPAAEEQQQRRSVLRHDLVSSRSARANRKWAIPISTRKLTRPIPSRTSTKCSSLRRIASRATTTIMWIAIRSSATARSARPGPRTSRTKQNPRETATSTVTTSKATESAQSPLIEWPLGFGVPGA